MARDQIAQYCCPVRMYDPLPGERIRVHPLLEQLVWVADERHPTGEAGAEVVADGSKHHSDAACHILARIGPAAFDHCLRPRVAHGEALASLAGRKQEAR